MPLTRCSHKGQYECIFTTVGPYRDDNKDTVLTLVDTLVTSIYGQHLKRRMIAAEIGEGGYHHIHILLEFRSPQRWRNFQTALLNACRKWVNNTEPQKPNVGCYIVPRQEPVNGKTNFDHIGVKYLSDPTKLKLTDDTASVIESDIEWGTQIIAYLFEYAWGKHPPEKAVLLAIEYQKARRHKTSSLRWCDKFPDRSKVPYGPINKPRSGGHIFNVPKRTTTSKPMFMPRRKSLYQPVIRSMHHSIV